MRIFLTGDTHGTLDIGKLSCYNFPEQRNLTKDDYLIVLGDFGAVWFGDKDETGKPFIPEGYKPHPELIKGLGGDSGLLSEYLNSQYTTLFVDGNHENHKLLNGYSSVSDWNGGKAHIINDSVIHLMRGQIYKLNGNTFFVMGGAKSTDKEYRVKDYSWFEEELPSDEEYEEAIRNLEKYDYTVDYVLSHCCSNRILYKLAPKYYVKNGFSSDRLTDFFDMLEDKLIIRKGWFFGHHHMDKVIDEKHRILFNDIVELE